MKKRFATVAGILALFMAQTTPKLYAQQSSSYLIDKGWRFSRSDSEGNKNKTFDDSKWQCIDLPHDWAIYGPFDYKNDRQNLAITQDGQKKAMEHAGRTGGLPFVGTGWYRTKLHLPEDLSNKYIEIRFDGAMSNAHVYLNEQFAGHWPYGYNSFYLDITPFVKPGKDNVLAVRLNNEHESSRWYPGAGIYRDVHLRITDKTHIKTWGTQIQTPFIDEDKAIVHINTTIEGLEYTEKPLNVHRSVIAPNGSVIWDDFGQNTLTKSAHKNLHASLTVHKPLLWDIGQPNLYKYTVALLDGKTVIDADTVTFGIRSIELKQNEGFFLNGRKIKFKGVCLHHDQGPLGAVANEASMRRQIRMMQKMGANAIRTSHNMPDPKFVKICDEMGMMLAVETFDSWAKAKVPNGYNKFFNEWHERDLVNMLHQYRNSASVMMYFIGNEVVEQQDVDGAKTAYMLQAICHREDPTRPVCNGMDAPREVMNSGMAATMDIPGFNYRPFLFPEGKKRLPQGFILGSETASTLSSRGVYKFPVKRRSMHKYNDHQASSYDVEHCGWSNLPEDDWMLHEDMPWAMGEFVWTGFDYIGEPTPYYSDWPSHSSLFGIVDLAGIPKDRYYLYKSHWNEKEHTLHVLPHWTWHGREGEITPIFVYTDHPEAEVWINGKSMGRQKKDFSIDWQKTENDEDKNNLTRQKRYRLMWTNTVYKPGTVKVVAYDNNGLPTDSVTVKTAGAAERIELDADRNTLKSDGKDLAFVTVRIVDKDGNLCPTDNRLLRFKVKGAGTFRAAASGNPASLDLFHEPKHHAFNGMLTVLVQSKKEAGTAELTVEGKGLKKASVKLNIHP